MMSTCGVPCPARGSGTKGGYERLGTGSRVES